MFRSLVDKGFRDQKLSVVASRLVSMSTTHQPPPTDVIGRTLVHVHGDFKSLVDAPVWSLDDKSWTHGSLKPPRSESRRR